MSGVNFNGGFRPLNPQPQKDEEAGKKTHGDELAQQSGRFEKLEGDDKKFKPVGNNAPATADTNEGDRPHKYHGEDEVAKDPTKNATSEDGPRTFLA